MPQQVSDFGEGVPRRDRDTGEVVELADDHQNSDSGHVARENRMGQQIRQKPQPSQPADQTHCTNRNRQSCSSLPRQRTTGRERGQRRPRHQSRSRLGAHRQLPRRPKNCIHRQRPHNRPQTSHGWKTGHLRIRHDLRNQISRDRTSRHDITAQPSPSVMPQNVDPREKPTTSAGPACSRILVRQKQPFCPRPQRRDSGLPETAH
jgi:hypothetical protein